MTKQETFDIVARHLLAQGKRSSIDGNNKARCLYRGPDGTKCAVGVLIDDKHYRTAMEGSGVSDDRTFGGQLVREELNRLGVDLGLAVELQAVHDHVDVSEWKEELSGVASRFGLRGID